MTIAEAIAKRIDEFLYKRGMTLYRLAKNSGLPISTLQNLYTGHTKSPTVSVLYKVCAGLEVSVEEFLNSEYFSPAILELD